MGLFLVYSRSERVGEFTTKLSGEALTFEITSQIERGTKGLFGMNTFSQARAALTSSLARLPSKRPLI